MMQDVIVELNWLKKEGLIADYAIGGAVAAQAYIEVSSTVDVDVFVFFTGPDANSLAPLSSISPKLLARGAKWDGQYFVIGGWKVQILPGGDQLTDDAIQSAIGKNFGEGVVGRIMQAKYLAALALRTGRDKDYPRVDEFLRRRAVTVDELRSLIEQHGLQAGWATFKTRFPAQNA